jgi:hypothetical protein
LSGALTAFRVFKTAKLKCLAEGICFAMLVGTVNINPLPVIGDIRSTNRATPPLPFGFLTLFFHDRFDLWIANMCTVQQILLLWRNPLACMFHF